MKIWVSISLTFSIERERKNIIPKAMRLNVRNTLAATRHHFPRFSSLTRGNTRRAVLCATSRKPFHAPQIIYIHDAPCHKPPISMVLNRLAWLRVFEQRLPPSVCIGSREAMWRAIYASGATIPRDSAT